MGDLPQITAEERKQRVADAFVDGQMRYLAVRGLRVGLAFAATPFYVPVEDGAAQFVAGLPAATRNARRSFATATEDTHE